MWVKHDALLVPRKNQDRGGSGEVSAPAAGARPRRAQACRARIRLIPKNHRVLDIPCGGGRVTILLGQLGYSVTAAELSEPMIAATRENLARAGLRCPVHREDIERMSYVERAFDAIVCFRLFHHFPDETVRRRVVKELCRVAAYCVVVSYFDPRSLTSLKRALRAKLGGKRSKQNATSLKEVERYFGGKQLWSRHGFCADARDSHTQARSLPAPT